MNLHFITHVNLKLGFETVRTRLEDELKKEVVEGLNDAVSRTARRQALDFIREKGEEIKQTENIRELKFSIKELKKRNLTEWKKLLARAVKQLKENGCQVFYAEDGKKVINYIKKIVDGDLIVKSKTNTGKEISLVKNLEQMGLEVVETDLGDRIVQLDGSNPSHPLVPALHIPRSRVLKLFAPNYETTENPSAEEIVTLARVNLRDKILNSDIGISGANAITAQEGLICLVENEGNQRLVTSIPRKHIVIVGIDKIVEDISEATRVAKTASIFGLGLKTAGYISFIKGPSTTGDLGFEIVKGMHGPKEVHVIILDNKRTNIIKSPYQEVLLCISCGGCVNYCPVYEQIGSKFGAGGGGRGALFHGLTRGLREGFQAAIDACTLCGACVQSCPTSIDVPNLIIRMRQEARSKKLRLAKHTQIKNQVLSEWNPFDKRSSKSDWIKKHKIQVNKSAKRLFFVGCMASYRIPEQAIYAMKLMNALDLDFNYLNDEEPCCAGILKRTGYEKDFSDYTKKVKEILKEFNEIIVICPGCYSTFNSFYGGFFESNLITVKHLVELLPGHLRKFGKKTNGVLTYHDPCHLGREGKIYDSPRQILKNIGTFREMGLNKEESYCCGAGGGCFSAFPDLTKQICKTRLNQALETEADFLINTCPFCEYNFQQSNTTRLKVTSLQRYLVDKCL